MGVNSRLLNVKFKREPLGETQSHSRIPKLMDNKKRRSK